MDNNYTISGSTDRDEYEILIKQKGDNEFQSYCPQLNLLMKGSTFDEVFEAIDTKIAEHISQLLPDDTSD